MLMFDMILRRLTMRGLQLLRRIGHDLQHAVDAVAQAQPFFQRLEMNITGAQPVRLEDHEIDQADDVRVVAGLRLLVRHLAGLRFLDLQLVAAVGRRSANGPSRSRCRNGA